MSNEGIATEVIASTLQEIGAPRSRTLRVPIIAARWHDAIMNSLIQGAQDAASRIEESTGVHIDTPVLRVPGTVELSVAAARVARSEKSAAEAIVALGVVIRGGTPHFDYVCQSVTYGLTEVSVRTGVPVGFGVLTCDTQEQAYARAGGPDSSEDKGAEALEAAVATALLLDATV